MKKMYRSRNNSQLFGICGGLADNMSMDANILRMILVISVVFTGGFTLLCYFIAAMVIPREPAPPSWSPYPAYGAPGYPAYPNQNSAYTGYNGYNAYNGPAIEPAKVDMDRIMRDVELKAMKQEIEQLKMKLNQVEKGDQ